MKKAQVKQIFQLALPLILQQFCLQLQIWIDRAMLGHLNAEFFSAIGNSDAPYHMVVSTITAVCGGTAILVAQGIGAKKPDHVREISGASFLGSSILCAGFFAFFFFFAKDLFRLMGVQPPILEHSTVYIRTMSFSLLILGPAATATAILQGLGFTKVIMAAGIAGNFLNIALDWLLIFGNLGFPALGIQGAALATVIANFLSAGLTILYVLCSPGMPFRLDPAFPLSGQLRCYRQVLQLGIPSGLEYALWNVGNLILISLLNRVDMMAAGIYTLVFSIETVPMLLYMGFANAGLTLVGQQTGANDPKQAKRTGLMCLYCSLVVCVAVGVIFHVFPMQLLGLFTNDRDTLSISVPYLIFVSWILFPKAVNNVIGLCIRGLGDTRWMLLTQIFGTCFMVCCGYWLILSAGMGLSGIFITLLLDEALRSIANLIHFLRS